jgi:hypothetical protein
VSGRGGRRSAAERRLSQTAALHRAAVVLPGEHTSPAGPHTKRRYLTCHRGRRKKQTAPPDEPGTDGDAAKETGDPPVEHDAEQLQQQLAERDATLAERDAEIAELQEELVKRGATIEALSEAAAAGETATPATPAASGEKRKVTYLGRPELISHDDDGQPTEDDVYSGHDPWSDPGSLTLAVGETAIVSAEKAEQLAADFPDAFDID